MTFHVLTLTQPWATLVASGAKQIETRGWATRYRGRLLIHAAAGLGPVGGPAGLAELCCRPPFCDALRAAGFERAADLPRGVIVAAAKLVAVYRIQAGGVEFLAADRLVRLGLADQERAFGDYRAGRYAWQLADVQQLKPTPMRGRLGIWRWEGEIEPAAS